MGGTPTLKVTVLSPGPKAKEEGRPRLQLTAVAPVAAVTVAGDRRSSRALSVALGCVIVAFCLLSFWPALAGGFVNWDDSYNFLYNYNFRGLSTQTIAWALGSRHLGVYQPLAWLLFEAEYSVWGLDPWGYHLTSMLLHSLNASLLYMVVLELAPRESGARWSLGAAVLTVLFACHPLRVEAVAWASCQPYLLSASFVLASTWCYLRFLAGRGGFWGLGCLVLVAAAVLSKAVAAPIIFLFITCQLLAKGRFERGPTGKQVLAFYAGAGTLSLAALGAALWARGEIHQSPLAEVLGLWPRLWQAAYAAGLYLEKSLWPMPLTHYYLRPTPLAAVFDLVLLAAALAWAAFYARRRPWLLAACGVSLAILAPNLGLVAIATSVAADRYTYLPALAFVVLFALCYEAGQRPRARISALLIAGLGLSCCYAYLSREQARVWHNSLLLWEHALTHGGESSVDVHNNLGLAYSESEDFARAEREYRKALQLNPNYSLAHANLGLSLLHQGRRDEAMQSFRDALARDPDLAEALNGFAYASLLGGDLPAAEAMVRRSLQLRPDDPVALNMLAQILATPGGGRLAEALLTINRSLLLNPADATALNTKGALLQMQGDARGAISAYEAALAQQPSFAEAHLNLADELLATGDKQGAAAHYQQVLRLRPGLPRARDGLARALVP